MTQPNDGAGASGGDTPPAPPAKTVEQRLGEMEENARKQAAQLQSAQEELKRVNNLNTVLMQRVNGAGSNSSDPNGGRGMDANNTTRIKLKRDFSQLDPASDPESFAREVVLETAEQVRDVMARDREQQATATNLRTAFYGKNKDLVGFEVEVGHFSSEVQSQNPGLPFDQAAEIIASKTREYLKMKGLTSNPDNPNPPHVLPPAGGGEGSGRVPIVTPDGKKTEAYDPDKSYQEDMKDYSAMRSRERERDGAKKV